MCGTASWEWEENKFAYEAVSHLCRGCYVKDAASDDTKRQPGVTIELHPTGTQESARRQLTAQQRHQARAEARQTRSKVRR